MNKVTFDIGMSPGAASPRRTIDPGEELSAGGQRLHACSCRITDADREVHEETWSGAGAVHLGARMFDVSLVSGAASLLRVSNRPKW
jgi:hypothetical protein